MKSKKVMNPSHLGQVALITILIILKGCGIKAGVDGFQIDCVYQDYFDRPKL